MPSTRARTSSSWLSWAIRIGRGIAVPLQPGGQAAAVPALEGRRQRGAHGLVEAEPLREHVGDLARGAEVQLGGLACRRRARTSTEREPADARPARARRG